MRNLELPNVIDYSVLAARNIMHGKNPMEVASLPPKPVMQFWLAGVTNVSPNSVEFIYKDRVVKLQGEGATALAARIYLMENIYPDVGLNGIDVVDIGANIGGTPVWFSINGARQVYAFEPAPEAYKAMKTNIRLNNLKNVTIENKAVLGKEGKTVISSDSCSGANVCGVGDFKVEAITLKDIVEKYSLKNTYLKMNIEGGEYEIFANSSDETLKAFKWIAMEYHYGKKRIFERLEPLGFNVKEYVEPKIQPNGMLTGRIIATRE